MRDRSEPTNLEEILDRIGQAEKDGGKETKMDDVMAEVGRRSFGPVLLVPGIITVMPVVGDIPGVPTVMAILVLLVSGQLLLGRDYFWLPQWILKRTIASKKIDKAMKWTRPPARFIDKFLRQRLTVFTHGAGEYAIAIACALIALMMPPMEVVPFTANGAGLALTLFGLSLMARDGLLALLAFIFTAATFGAVIYFLV
ncbi:MAG: exopolysaccharide biosynthesis protein [Natronospirillum sp.]